MRKDPHHFRVWDYNPSEVVARSAVVKFAQRWVKGPGEAGKRQASRLLRQQ